MFLQVYGYLGVPRVGFSVQKLCVRQSRIQCPKFQSTSHPTVPFFIVSEFTPDPQPFRKLETQYRVVTKYIIKNVVDFDGPELCLW